MITKEEVDLFCKNYYGYTIEESDKDIGYWMDKYYKLQQENKELHNKINKAIEYINKNGEKQYNHHDNYRGKWYSPDELDTLLQILVEKVGNNE